MAFPRPLHYVLKIADRRTIPIFYEKVLGMKVLRHEEFDKGCEAHCNGPYDNKWSKTMIGYGPEDSNFVLELAYNYSLKKYIYGNDLGSITINSEELFQKCESETDLKCHFINNGYSLLANEGYPFVISKDKEREGASKAITKVTLSCSDLATSKHFYTRLLKLRLIYETEDVLLYHLETFKFKLELVKATKVNHGTAQGRIAFSCLDEDFSRIEAEVEKYKGKILIPLTSLDTPGKATVKVVIFTDPDGHEICYVGDEAFRELSQVDPNALDSLNKAIEADKSIEWAEKKAKKSSAQK